MGISGFFGKRNLSKITADVTFPQEVYANKEVPLSIRLKNNRHILPVFLMKVHLEEKETLFPFIDRNGEAAKHISISFAQRGRYEINHIHICSVFPFNFFTRCRKIERPFEIIVFPEPQKCELSSLFEKEKTATGERLSDKTGYAPEIISIREYRQGDPLKYIHWKATAKTGKLKTRELASPSFQPVVIDFEKIVIKNIEERISCIAYLILNLYKKNIPVGLRINSRLYKPDSSPAHKTAMLKELALYGAEK